MKKVQTCNYWFISNNLQFIPHWNFSQDNKIAFAENYVDDDSCIISNYFC